MAIRIYIYKMDNIKDTDKQSLLREALCLYLSSTPGKIFADLNNLDEEMLMKMEFSLEEGTHGKPFFSDEKLGKLHFSISHSGKYWAIAFAKSEVGLDIEDIFERKHNIEKYKKIADRFFTHDEISYINSFEKEDEVTLGFFRVWTRKEAFLKYTGEGISRQLNDFSTLSALPTLSVIDDKIGLDTLLKTNELVCSCCAGKKELIDTSIEFVQKISSEDILSDVDEK